MKYQPLKKPKRTKFDIFKERAEYILTNTIDYRTQQGISHSQYEIYAKCPLAWYYQYPKKLVPFQQTIHTCFGTVMHGTIQDYIKTVYSDSAKSADMMDLDTIYSQKFVEEYTAQKTKNKGQHFSTLEEITLFDSDAQQILKAIKKERAVYFPTKQHELIGIELPIRIEIAENLYFQGFIDLVIYDGKNDIYIIYDLKTSTSGWSAIDKGNRSKTAQMVAYKEFFSKQYDIPLEKIRCEYIILRRRINTDLEFVPKRIQSYEPPMGPRIVKDWKNKVTEFITTRFTSDAKYVQEPPEATPSDSACKFCHFRNKKDLCPNGIG